MAVPVRKRSTTICIDHLIQPGQNISRSGPTAGFVSSSGAHPRVIAIRPTALEEETRLLQRESAMRRNRR